MRTDTETAVCVDREGYVVYRLLPCAAAELAQILTEQATRTNDTGWREDAIALARAVEKAESHD